MNDTLIRVHSYMASLSRMWPLLVDVSESHVAIDISMSKFGGGRSGTAMSM